MDPVALPNEEPGEERLEPPFDEIAWRRHHVAEVAGQATFVVAGVGALVSGVYTGVCIASFSVTWERECVWPARVAVATTGLTLLGGGAAIYGSYGEAKALRMPWVEGTIGVGALGLSVPTFAFGTYYLLDDNPRATPWLLAGVGLADLGLAATACQVRYGHREARRLRLLGTPPIRLRNDVFFCSLLDAITVAVTPEREGPVPTAVIRGQW